jgi:hypothetical protein
MSAADSTGRHAGLQVVVTGLGPVRLGCAIARNPETSLYLTDRPGVVVKVFDLDCPQPDEIGYGPYLNFQAELATFEELQATETLRLFVPTYYGAGVDYDRKFAFIAMEFLPGVNLRAWAEETAAAGYDAAALDELRRATQEVLSIVDLFHRHGLVLIDFKPDNVIRLHDGTVRLVDLGAFFTPRHQRHPGTFVYAATPDHAEVVIDASNLQAGVPPGVASDVFAAGVALFELATGTSRLALDAATAEEMLAAPAMYLFRDSQIADIWKAFPHLKEALPLVQTQLRERRLLFSEFWHLLKSYLATKVPDWEAMDPAGQEQVLLSTGTTFILEQLPHPLAWLAGAIAQATVLRSLRVPNVGALAQLLGNPAPVEVLEDIAAHNCLVRQLGQLGLPADFAARLNTWDVRRDPESGHWAIAAPAACWELAENAAYVFLRQTHADDEDHTYWHAVDEFDADESNGGRANLAELRQNHRAWLGSDPGRIP